MTQNQQVQQIKTNIVQELEKSEKITVRQRGKTLIFIAAGKPGRYCALFHKTTKMKKYDLLIPSKTVINPSIIARIVVDMSNLVDSIIVFHLVTSESSRFKTDLRGTLPFMIQILNRNIFKINTLESKTSKGIGAATVASTYNRGTQRSQLVCQIKMKLKQ
jgi:hypothetical protein